MQRDSPTSSYYNSIPVSQPKSISSASSTKTKAKTMLNNLFHHKSHSRRNSSISEQEAGRYHKLDTPSCRRRGAAQVSDEELLKYIGKTREELIEWAKHRPGVAGNQPAWWGWA
ncbi:hypothetical protein GE09DRAFT_494281 [Coniochaeta sp. 2T2.1]|nr:hypothetical protein GE09DRAFT_494281 [Coniochaeta sp. 2T2.1]